MRKQSDKTKLIYARAALKNALDCLDRIANTPSLPNPERDADWKSCMKNSAYDARETAGIIRKSMGIASHKTPAR